MVKIYCTKYALTRGIEVLEAEPRDFEGVGYFRVQGRSCSLLRGGTEAHLSLSAARERCDVTIRDELERLRQRAVMLEQLLVHGVKVVGE